MIRINALYFMLIAEALIIMTALCAYLFYLKRKEARASAGDKGDFRLFIEAQLKEKLEEMKQAIAKEGASDNAEARLDREMISVRLQFLKAALDGIRTNEGYKNCWVNISKVFDEIVGKQIQGRKDVLSGEALSEGSPEAAKGDHKKLRDKIEGYAKKITALLELKDILADLQNKTEAIRKSNIEFNAGVTDLLGKGGGLDTAKDMLEGFENSNKELEVCTGTLGLESARLSEEYAAWQEELKRISEDKEEAAAAEAGEGDKLQQENNSLMEKIKGLEASIESKDKIYAELQRKFDALEQEYLVLYKEKFEGS